MLKISLVNLLVCHEADFMLATGKTMAKVRLVLLKHTVSGTNKKGGKSFTLQL